MRRVKNIEAENITIKDASGNTSLPASSSESTLMVDTISPRIKAVKLEPMITKSVTTGDAVLVTVISENNEVGLIPSDAIVSGTSVKLSDRGDGSYTGTYTILMKDTMNYMIEAENITLTDPAGNISDPVSSNGSGIIIEIPLTIDRVDFNNDGIVNLGDLIIMGRSWSSTQQIENFNSIIDLNRNGTIEIGDLVLLARYWEQTYVVSAKRAKNYQ